MDSLWPWLAVAGIGALHGLNPAGGWLWAAAWAVRRRDRTQALRAVLPIAIGHLASIAMVAAAVPIALSLGVTMDRWPLQLAAAILLGLVVLPCLRRRAAPRPGVARTGVALVSFIVATAQGAGLMLVPALVPLCIGAGPVRQITASGSMTLALAAVAVHTAAMLVVTAALALAACCALRAGTAYANGASAAPMRAICASFTREPSTFRK
jgi:hypothetical protein